MREIRTSGSMSGVEETGLWKTSVSGWGESLPAQSAPTFLQVPRLPPTLRALLRIVARDGYVVGKRIGVARVRRKDDGADDLHVARESAPADGAADVGLDEMRAAAIATSSRSVDLVRQSEAAPPPPPVAGPAPPPRPHKPP